MLPIYGERMFVEQAKIDNYLAEYKGKGKIASELRVSIYIFLYHTVFLPVTYNNSTGLCIGLRESKIYVMLYKHTACVFLEI